MTQRFSYRLLLIVLLPLLVFPAAAAEYDGRIGWAQQANLSMPVNGVVSTINVSPGMRVKKGEVMLSLDQRYFDAELVLAGATLARLRPGRDEAKKELGRAQELFDRTVLSQVELDQARIDFAEKAAQHREADATFQRVKLDKEYSQLKAPYELIAIRVLVVPGQTVVNQLQVTPMVVVADANRLQISFSARAADASGLRLGGMVSVGDKSRSAKATVIALDAVQGSKTVQVQLIVDRKSIPALRVGGTVKVQW